MEIEVAATFFVLGVLMLLLGFLQLFMTARQAGKIFWKRRYEFNENKVIFINYLNGINMIKTDWDIDRIKTIKDEGLYYEIFVKRNKLICEKSLIKEGTIEEFEQRFGDKIKKRKKECQ
ncbi:hypothetical protein FACS1894211_08280 [Clostridia bacterium]|nr:hypothetical protein FACS1894211_08280 [Clostridia bacterium]